MTVTEITQQQFEDVMGYNYSKHTNCPNCPAEYLAWGEADLFCRVMGGRLPIETEWELAARGGTTTRYY